MKDKHWLILFHAQLCAHMIFLVPDDKSSGLHNAIGQCLVHVRAIDPARETVTNPKLIVEVLSPSSELYDRGEKFERYLFLDSLEEYVLVSQSSPRVEVYTRQPERSWLFTPRSELSDSAKLRSLGIEIPLAEIYAGAQFPET